MQEILDSLSSKGLPRSIKKRTVLLYQGEVPRSAYYLKKGVVKAYSINSAGNEQIVSFYVAGDLIPMSWIFGPVTSTLYYYEALIDCELIAFDKKTLNDLVYGKPRLLVQMFNYSMRNYTSAQMRITALEQSRANEKIMFTLYYLVFRYGVEVKPGVFAVRLGLTHAVIAEMVGLTRETTAVELNKLKKAGAVNYNTKEYVIKREVLERLMGEDSFSSLMDSI
jgi:CRP-like cAMP-binding protein